MRAVTRSVLAAAAAGSLSAALLPSVAGAVEYPAPAAAGAHDGVAAEKSRWRPDNLPNPLAEKQLALRQKAQAQVMRGTAELRRGRAGSSDVVKLGRKQYVEVSREATDKDPDQIFTILVEFGKKRKEGTPLGIPGPVHNQIPKPDRDVDNSTYWEPKFPRSHYRDLMFGDKNSMAHFYKKQSWGNYAIDGDVSNWVKVPFRESRYGYNKDQADGYWTYVKHTARAWYQAKRDAGWSNARIQKYLRKFDEWDRYDADGDGNFEEPDGYIDHFQAVHAGEGEESGAPGWTIWSHRWYAHLDLFGVAGPPGYAQYGGVPIGKSGIWIGDYFTAPENGGLGVFAHEFGHDLGLADYYDTAGGDNGTGFWTLMSAGSWLNKSKWHIGTKPGYMGPHEKLLLGWLDYQYMPYAAGTTRRSSLNPAEIQTGFNSEAPPSTTNTAQALVVGLPQASKTVHYNEPFEGEYEWWGGSADNLNSSLTYQDLNLTNANAAKLTAMAWYDIEEGYDYLYLEVSTDNGTTWEQVHEANHPDGGIDGSTTDWEKIKYDLTDYVGDTVDVRFRYQTDGGVHYAGPFLDRIRITVDGEIVNENGAETGETSWTPGDSWKRSTGSETTTASQYYIAENRRYLFYDRVLRSGPYNFGWAYTRPNWVERFPYQDGMLVWYWNNLYEDNNTSEHPGHGWVLPVDAFPEPITFADGSLLGNRRQPFDATFGRSVTDPVKFHREVADEDGDVHMMVARVPGRPMKPVFNDTDKKRYWSKANPWGSVKVAGTGTKIKVKYETSGGYRIDLRVVQAAPAG